MTFSPRGGEELNPKRLKRKLRVLAPAHMSEPIIPAGEFILGKSLQIFWCTEYSNQKGKITCWCLCFSRFNLKEEKKDWFLAIHVRGRLNSVESNELIRVAKRTHNTAHIRNNDNGVLLIYPRPLFHFSDTLTFLRLSIKHLTGNR